MASQSPSDLQVACINRLKFAVATAVIRCKPSQMTARQFAESLGQRLRKRQSDWKGRAEKLEADLLRTRQELAIARLREAGQFQEELATDWDTADTEPCQDAAIPSLPVCPEMAFPTPPSSIPTEPAPQNTLENHLKTSMQFLHSVTRLKSLSYTLEETGSVNMDTLHIIRDSTLRGMDDLMNYVSVHLNESGFPWKLMNDAVRGIVGVLECCGVEEVCQDVIKRATGLADELLQHIMSNNHLYNHHTQHQLCYLIVSLASSQSLAPIILSMTLADIQIVASMLQRSISGSSLDPTLYENGSYLLSVMEDTLLLPRTIPSAHTEVNKMDGKMAVDMIERLEDCLLHITNDFPLFCQHVWRVVSILKWISCPQNEEKVDEE